MAHLSHIRDLNTNKFKKCYFQYIIYDNASQGLVVATALERIIHQNSPHDSKASPDDTKGKIVHIYFTGNPQTQCLGEMNYSNEDLSRYLTTLNMFHLRSLEQGVDIVAMGQQDQLKKLDRKRKHETVNLENKDDCDIVHFNENSIEETIIKNENIQKEITGLDEAESQINALANGQDSTKVPYRQRMREESTLSYNIINEKKMDGLIIVAKQHPTNILLHLIKYLAPSRPFVVFCSYKEPLMDAYFAVKETGKTVFVTLTETWLRNYQVLPERTHPEVLMSGGGGYILFGTVVDNKDPPENGFEGSSQKAVNGNGCERKNKRFRRR